MHTLSRPRILLLISSLLLAACGGSDSPKEDKPKTSTIYSTTSSRGDYAEWSLVGNQLSFDWQDINGTGEVDHTFSIEATCAAAAATGLRECTIVSASCTAGVSACPAVLPSGSIGVTIVPDVALYAIHDGQLHIGFARDESACSADVSGDYSYVHLGHGKRDLFGLYRSDNNFINVVHIDYGVTNAAPILAFPDEELTPQRVSYNSGTPTELFIDGGCANGLRQRSNGEIDVRLMATDNGLFVLDLPEGEGGFLAFEQNNAATIEDFANKSFGGLFFSSDESDPLLLEIEPFSVTTGNALMEEVAMVAQVMGETQNLTLMPLSGNDVPLPTQPAYPDFSVSPVYDSSGILIPANSSLVNPLYGDYNRPNDLPGFFKLDGNTSTGRFILAAVEINNKTIAFGSAYKFKKGCDDNPLSGCMGMGVDINPATGTFYEESGYYITGNWVMFEQ